MTDYLLDSNHASPLVTLSHPLREKVLSEIDNGNTFALSVPVLTETLFGLHMLPSADRSITEWARLRHGIICYQVDESDAEIAATLQASLRKKGWQLETVDALIAATALRYKLVLLTSDRDFSAILELKRENWLA